MEKYHVLFVGESWFFTTTETKGTDQFTMGGYQTEIGRVREYMKEYAQIEHVPAHLVPELFPDSLEELQKYDIVLVSDVGANTFLLHPDTFFSSKPTVNRLQLIKEFVEQGGAFGMIGGYMTFMGIEGKGHYKGTPLEEILPVMMKEQDDRMEVPQGFRPCLADVSNPVLSGLDGEWPYLLGYNQTKAKDDAKVLMKYGDDPILVLGEYGRGRTFAWTSDCAPHWMPQEFCESVLNKRMWDQIFDWCIQKRSGR